MKTSGGLRGLLAAMAVSAATMLSAPAAAQVGAEGGWVLATPPGAKSAAAYLVFTNKGEEPRKLLKIVSTVSDQVSMHASSIDAQGVARMWPLSGLEIGPGEVVRFEPGGRHVMLDALKAPLVAGGKVPLTLRFDGGEPEFTILLEVRPLVPAAADHSRRDHN